VIDDKGNVMKSLAVAAMREGHRSIVWDGTRSNGQLVSDGSYQLLVAAAAAGRVTTTLRTPVRVDRTLPSLTITGRPTGVKRSAGLVIRTTVRSSEAGSVVVRTTGGYVRRVIKQGTNFINIPASALGIRAATRPRSVPVSLTMFDVTGNSRLYRRQASIPAFTKTQITRPTVGPPVISTQLGWPVPGVVTSPYGPRWGRMHTGLDLNAPLGTPVVAAASGTVAYVGPMDGYGILVILQHANGLQTYYAHLTRPEAGLVVGDQVSRSSALGLSGCTGRCTGPHVHFETRINGMPRDPLPYMVGR
jgi:murein DD-endopeptidase MepM/ murein hydrolase activator NlpD